MLYGMYIKIYPKASKNHDLDKIVSLKLEKNKKIKSMQVINNNRILIIINDDNEIEGLVYDIDSQKIIQRIQK